MQVLDAPSLANEIPWTPQTTQQTTIPLSHDEPRDVVVTPPAAIPSALAENVPAPENAPDAGAGETQTDENPPRPPTDGTRDGAGDRPPKRPHRARYVLLSAALAAVLAAGGIGVAVEHGR